MKRLVAAVLAVIVPLPLLAQPLPPRLQQQVNAGLMSRETALRLSGATSVSVKPQSKKVQQVRSISGAVSSKQEVLKASPLKPVVYSNPSENNTERGRSLAQDLFGSVAVGDAEKVRALLDQGAYVDARSTGMLSGWTPLGLASQAGKTEIVKLLLDRGADPNLKSQDSTKFTPLMAASMQGHRDTVKALLVKKADPNIVSNYIRASYTALSLAEDKGFKDVIDTLKSHGARETSWLRAPRVLF